jgi:soluble cytochrome b562
MGIAAIAGVEHADLGRRMLGNEVGCARLRIAHDEQWQAWTAGTAQALADLDSPLVRIDKIRLRNEEGRKPRKPERLDGTQAVVAKLNEMLVWMQTGDVTQAAAGAQNAYAIINSLSAQASARMAKQREQREVDSNAHWWGTVKQAAVPQ